MPNQYFDRIEQYLSGSLSSAEKQDFEEELKKNELLAQALNKQLIVREALELSVENNLKERFKSLSDQEKNIPEALNKNSERIIKTGKSTFYLLKIAAGIILLVGIAALYFYISTPRSNQEIASKYYQKLDPYSILRSGTTKNSFFKNASEAMAEGNFAEAKSILLDIPSTDSQYTKGRLALSHIAYEMKDYTNSMSYAREVIDSGDIRYKEKAELIAILTSLAKDDLNTFFNSLLDSVTQSPNHSYYDQAIEIKKLLD